jgi:hypothetical protein
MSQTERPRVIRVWPRSDAAVIEVRYRLYQYIAPTREQLERRLLVYMID